MSFLYAGLALVAGSILLVEIALTRVFAVMMWHHLTYMAVSVAMLGFGTAGSLLTVRGSSPAPGREFGDRSLVWLATAYGVSVVVCFFVATRVPLDTLAIWREKSNLLWLAALYGVVALPFLFGGFVVGRVLTRGIEHVNRLYFADLLGSALGGAASVWLLARLGSSATVMLAAALGLLGASAFALAGPRVWLRLSLPLLAGACLLCACLAGGLPAVGLPGLDWPVPFAPGKELSRIPAGEPIVRIPSSTAEVEVGPSAQRLPGIGGNFGRRDLRRVEAREVGQDGTAPTMLFRDAAQLERFPFLDDSQAGSAYVALAARGAADPRVLVIGVGGGIDVMIALANGARHVTAVEFNRGMLRMLREDFDDYLGGLFRPGAHPLADRIDLVHGEGRAHVRSRKDRYDVIQLSGVDSFTALSTGAYTLAESYLYTVEAVQDFYLHLEDGGILNYSRFFMQHPKKPRETLRLAHIAWQALHELGVEDPASHILVFRGRNWASIMIRRGPFVPIEVAALRDFATTQGFFGLVFDPLWQPSQPLPESPLEPAGNGPFRSAQILFANLLRGSAEQQRRFIADYDYDISASTDDSPFFFNYYRYSGLLRAPAAHAPAAATSHQDTNQLIVMLASEPYHPEFPVGHMVLIASLAQMGVLATLCIGLPLRSLARRGLRSPRRWRVLAYFSALGAGFMFIEIVLMQKLVLFLGHPTHSISVVLTSLLAFAGFGSLLAGRIEDVSDRVLRGLGGAVLGVLAVEWLAIAWLLPAWLGADFAWRVGATILLLAPLGLVLGMPFPLGLRRLAQQAPELLPWAWAINGLLSVLSSVLCIVLAMAMGFSTVFAVAAVIYAAGFLAMTTGRGRGGA